METLKFLFTSSFYPPYHIGGDAVHVRYLAEELANRGHEVHVFHSLDAYETKKTRSKAQEEQDAVFTHPVETILSRSAYEAYVFGGSRVITGKFRALVDEVKPDIVHHHNISLLGHSILRKRGSYLNLYTAHDYWLICPQSNLLRDNQVCETSSCVLCGLTNRRPPQLWRYLASFKKSVGSVDVLIAPSNYVRRRITERFAIQAITIPNFVPKPPTQARSSGFSNFFLFAGTLEKHKGILRLVENWEQLAEHDSSRLIIAGEGPLRKEVRKLIKHLEPKPSVLLLGWTNRNRLLALLSDARALIVPSISPENAPLVSLEALSVGTPIIGSNRGGLPEIVSRLDPRLVFSWEEDGGLVRAFNFLNSNYESLKEKAIQTYTVFFSPDVYLKSYAKLVAMRPNQPGNMLP